MHKVFTVFFLMLTISAAHATKLSDAEIEKKATALTLTMAKRLELNEQEYIQVKALNLEKLHAVNDIMDNYKYDLKLRNVKLKEVEKAYAWQLKHALNAKQIEHYLAWHRRSEPSLTSILAQ